MRKILITSFVFALSVASLSPAAKAQTRCETLKSDIQAMLGQEYSGKGQAAALEYSKRIVKAYQMGFKNSNCLTVEEYEGLVTGVVQLQEGCAVAKRSKSKWKQFSARCNLYQVLYKYSVSNSV
jgi:hypothetical protein